MKKIKYLIIPVIALGLALSMVCGVEYKCAGKEMFPTYYGSPFVFKQSSLGSSMEYNYSISGLLLNVAVWSVLIGIIEYGVVKLLNATPDKEGLVTAYKIFVGLLLAYSFLNIVIAYIGLGSGFDKTLNYWYWDLDKEAKNWGMKCEGEWKFLIL